VAIDQTVLRLSIFLSLFALIAVAELAWPRRQPERGQRWATNLGLLVMNTGMLRLLSFALPALPVVAAFAAQQWRWGLLPLLGVPDAAAAVIGFVVLDLAVYGQHVAMHFVPALWRMHRVHHADGVFDVTTGLRFHPLEILISQAWKIAVIVAVGLPVAAALVFEIALNAASMFSHANLRLPHTIERALRFVIVTPEMHRVHHSVERDEHDSNFGFNFSLWDRLFATYRATARLPQETMAIGLAGQRDGASFPTMLRYPFARGAS
jgi:sterol desaturase/sphingolipid hydroxylase (fatty acid hydroxylase superfamily)